MTNQKDKRKMKSMKPHVPRLIEFSNDVEKNPGPPKMIKTVSRELQGSQLETKMDQQAQDAAKARA